MVNLRLGYANPIGAFFQIRLRQNKPIPASPNDRDYSPRDLRAYSREGYLHVPRRTEQRDDSHAGQAIHAVVARLFEEAREPSGSGRPARRPLQLLLVAPDPRRDPGASRRLGFSMLGIGSATRISRGAGYGLIHPQLIERRLVQYAIAE